MNQLLAPALVGNLPHAQGVGDEGQAGKLTKSFTAIKPSINLALTEVTDHYKVINGGGEDVFMPCNRPAPLNKPGVFEAIFKSCMAPPQDLSKTKLYTCMSSDLYKFLLGPNKNSLVAIDTRADLFGYPTFKNGVIIPVVKTSLEETAKALKTWADKPENAYDLSVLLKAGYVLIHCNEGQSRSPAMMLAYAYFYINTLVKNPNQKICLLHRGVFSGWIGKDGWDPLVGPEVGFAERQSFLKPYRNPHLPQPGH